MAKSGEQRACPQSIVSQVQSESSLALAGMIKPRTCLQERLKHRWTGRVGGGPRKHLGTLPEADPTSPACNLLPTPQPQVGPPPPPVKGKPANDVLEMKEQERLGSFCGQREDTPQGFLETRLQLEESEPQRKERQCSASLDDAMGLMDQFSVWSSCTKTFLFRTLTL
ncbi:hypothetical protein TREES_T100010103 [Tupaia chinensis]|uniref:Uncharacterized protein n=1 Tax=Tupaia chinensis TaxID=246437 RepID=L9JCF0_TUPCH|nr:hypothetical protein TREES_T100010103 [Tupaia chinensis]